MRATIFWAPRSDTSNVQRSHSFAAAAAALNPLLIIDTCGAVTDADLVPGWHLVRAAVIPRAEIRRSALGFRAVVVNHLRDGQSLAMMSDFEKQGLLVFASMQCADAAEARRALQTFGSNPADWKLVDPV